MSIDDDIFDVADAVSKTGDNEAFQHIISHINKLEQAVELFQKSNNELQVAVRVMMGIRDE